MDWSLAQRLLEDGASYREVARTLGCSRGVVMHRLPGFGWSYSESGTYRQMLRRLEVQ